MEMLNIIKKEFELAGSDINTYSPLTLAFIGDSVYGMVVKSVVTLRGNCPPNQLNNKSTMYVKAVSQAKIVDLLEEENMLSEEEASIIRRGRNAKASSVAKNASVGEYRKATGLEALVGYLYLTDNTERLVEIISAGMSLLDNA